MHFSCMLSLTAEYRCRLTSRRTLTSETRPEPPWPGTRRGSGTTSTPAASGWPHRSNLLPRTMVKLQGPFREYCSCMLGKAHCFPRIRTILQESRLLRHAASVHAAAGAGSAASFDSPPRPARGAPRPVYEMRTYQLHPGYGNVPAVVKAFETGWAARLTGPPSTGHCSA